MGDHALKVALLQLPGTSADPDANLHDGEAACREAASRGADIALFPELWQTGYARLPYDEDNEPDWLALATTRTEPFVEHFRALARELEMAIVITYAERWDGYPRNTATLFDRHGQHVLTYAKVHTCDFGMEKFLTPGDGFRVATLDARVGSVEVGLMICYDREFPESARTLMLCGAELILVPNACHISQDHIAQLRARAFENMVGIAMANYSLPGNNGWSAAFDGMPFTADGKPREQRLLEADGESGIHVVEFELDALRHWRETETWGDAYRKPGRYAPLVRQEAAPPFARADSRR
jgi:predicted amidohydrolase